MELPAEIYARLRKELVADTRVVLLTHFNPDGDAIGSILGMYWFLKKRGCQVRMAVPNEIPQFLRWMKGAEEILDFQVSGEEVKAILNEADIVFCIDFNEPERLRGIQSHFEKCSAFKILVDHHPYPAEFTDHGISDTSVSSAAELVYRLITDLDASTVIDHNIAEGIFVGIMTDTGCFSFNSSDPKTYQVVGHLLSTGIDKDRIHSLVYDNYTEERMRMLGFSLTEKMVVMPEHRTAYISLSKEELRRFSHQQGDTEGFVNYPFSIRGIRVTALFLEREDHIKISLRSKGEFAINGIVAEHFNGGGHNNAAGGESYESLADTIRKFEEVIREHSDENKRKS